MADAADLVMFPVALTHRRLAIREKREVHTPVPPRKPRWAVRPVCCSDPVSVGFPDEPSG